jgi:CheY-like chemotaxis protein
MSRGGGPSEGCSSRPKPTGFEGRAPLRTGRLSERPWKPIPPQLAGPGCPGAAPHDETEGTSVTGTGHHRPRVLLVEDDPGTRHFLRRILESEGIDVIGEAGHGARAIELVRVDPPDVVLMDLRMPGVGGIEATRAIKEVAPLTQVVILTVYEGPLPTRSAEQVGAYATS